MTLTTLIAGLAGFALGFWAGIWARSKDTADAVRIDHERLREFTRG